MIVKPWLKSKVGPPNSDGHKGGSAVTFGTDTVAFIIYVLIRLAEPMRIVS
jgi:hypothetical protein